MNKIILLNAYNLNLLGRKSPHRHGTHTLSAIETQRQEKALALNTHQCLCPPNNLAYPLSRHTQNTSPPAVHTPPRNVAALMPTRMAIMKALPAINCPLIEAHTRDTTTSKSFRNTSSTSNTIT